MIGVCGDGQLRDMHVIGMEVLTRSESYGRNFSIRLNPTIDGDNKQSSIYAHDCGHDDQMQWPRANKIAAFGYYSR